MGTGPQHEAVTDVAKIGLACVRFEHIGHSCNAESIDMSGDDSAPDFNWLKRGIDNKEVGRDKKLVQESNLPEPGPPMPLRRFGEAVESQVTLNEDQTSLVNETLPPLIPNDSDGSTMILRGGDSACDLSRPEEPTAVDFSQRSSDSLDDSPTVVLPPEELSGQAESNEAPPSPTQEQPEEAVQQIPSDDATIELNTDSTPELNTVVADEQSNQSFEEPVIEGSAEPESSIEEFAQATEADAVESETAMPNEPAPESVPRTAASAAAPQFSGPPDFLSGGGAAAGVGAFAAAGAMAFSSDPSSSAPSSSGTKSVSQKKKANGEAEGGKSGRLLIFLGMYAVAITLALLLMLIKEINQTFRPHQLESLPDIPAEKVENLSYIPANMKLPVGHSVALGEARRFGNILVEPIKITEEPVEFVHYSGDPKRKKAATEPVWKLWLKLTNVSDSQTIAPLDRRLVLRWVTKAKQNWDFTNQYITGKGASSRTAPSLQLYRLPPQGDWDLKDQELGKVLQPGESYVTYLASSDDGFDALGDSLVWRVQLRKGYSPKGNGVTTIFEVPFRKEDVHPSQS